MTKAGILVGLVLIMACPALAQDNMRLSVYIGPSLITGERSFLAEEDQPVSTEYDIGFNAGVRLTGDFSDQLSGELGYDFGRNAFDVVQTGTVTEDRSFDLWVQHLTVNGVFYFIPPDPTRWRPYATAGIGWTRYSPTDQARRQALADKFLTQPTRIRADNMLSFNFGGGAERQIGDGPVGLRLEVRDYISDQPTFGLPETSLTPGGVFLPSPGSSHNLEATAGLTFSF